MLRFFALNMIYIEYNCLTLEEQKMEKLILSEDEIVRVCTRLAEEIDQKTRLSQMSSRIFCI